MREIIPIKKDILFKTSIGEITNIDLDYDYKINENLIEGNIILNGSYKMTEASVLEDDFNYKIPFKVSISKEVNKESIKIEIDDFKYEVKKDILSTQVDLLFTCEEVKEEHIELDNPVEEVEMKEEKTEIVEDNINNITNIINTDNNYYTYKVYIVRENDTIDSICMKYNININELKEYNEINEIKEGDKLIIPYINE